MNVKSKTQNHVIKNVVLRHLNKMALLRENINIF